MRLLLRFVLIVLGTVLLISSAAMAFAQRHMDQPDLLLVSSTDQWSAEGRSYWRFAESDERMRLAFDVLGNYSPTHEWMSAYTVDEQKIWTMYLINLSENIVQRVDMALERRNDPDWLPGEAWAVINVPGNDGQAILMRLSDGFQLDLKVRNRVSFGSYTVYEDWIFYRVVADQPEQDQLYRLNLHGEQPELLFTGSFEDISFYNDQLLVLSYDEEAAQSTLYRMNLDGTTQETLFSVPGLIDRPEFSSDGTWAAYSVTHKNPPKLYAINLKTQQSVLLSERLARVYPEVFDLPYHYNFAFTSGGSLLYLEQVSYRNVIFTLYRYDLQQDSKTVLADGFQLYQYTGTPESRMLPELSLINYATVEETGKVFHRYDGQQEQQFALEELSSVVSSDWRWSILQDQQGNVFRMDMRTFEVQPIDEALIGGRVNHIRWETSEWVILGSTRQGKPVYTAYRPETQTFIYDFAGASDEVTHLLNSRAQIFATTWDGSPEETVYKLGMEDEPLTLLTPQRRWLEQGIPITGNRLMFIPMLAVGALLLYGGVRGSGTVK